MQEQVRKFFRDIGLRVKRVSKGESEYNVHCPFHEDSDASMYINLDKGVFCFGACGFGGSLFSLFSRMDKLTARERLYNLSLISAMHLTDWIKDDIIKSNDNEIEEINYGELEMCNEDMPYLQERSIKKRTIEQFNLHYDKRMQCIVVPVYNNNGDDIGYIKRNLGSGNRYINSPDLAVNDILFPMDKVERYHNKIILVEGVFDAIRAHQEGFNNTLSNLGGSISKKQINILGEYTRNVVLCFDKDMQGIMIAKKSMAELQKYGFVVELAVAPGAAKDLAGASSMANFHSNSYQKLVFFGKNIDYLVYGR